MLFIVIFYAWMCVPFVPSLQVSVGSPFLFSECMSKAIGLAFLSTPVTSKLPYEILYFFKSANSDAIFFPFLVEACIIQYCDVLLNYKHGELAPSQYCIIIEQASSS